MADTTVVLVGLNEGVLGTSIILRSFEEARADGAPAPDDCFVVLSRIPQYYFDDEGKMRWFTTDDLRNAKIKMSNEVRSRLDRIEKVNTDFSFSSEPRLEIREELPIKFVGPAMNSPLSSDYLEFFSELVPELTDDLRKLAPDVRVLRPYYLIENEGRLVNPEDSRWNVAFRQDTLCRTFDNLYAAIVQSEMRRGVSKEAAEEAADRALRDEGTNSAKDFSLFLKQGWEKQVRESRLTPTFDAKIREWCRFDSTVGFGKFDVAEVWGEGKVGTIKLANSFLTFGRRKEDSNLCSFMTGYITCVLETVFGAGVEVTHDLDTQCGQYQDNEPKACLFSYRVKD